ERSGQEQSTSESEGECAPKDEGDLGAQVLSRRRPFRNHRLSMSLPFMNLMYELSEPSRLSDLDLTSPLRNPPSADLAGSFIYVPVSWGWGGTSQCLHSPKTPSRTAFESDRTTT